MALGISVVVGGCHSTACYLGQAQLTDSTTVRFSVLATRFQTPELTVGGAASGLVRKILA